MSRAKTIIACALLWTAATGGPAAIGVDQKPAKAEPAGKQAQRSIERGLAFLERTQAPDGSWNGDGIGTTYGTAIATIILQLPYGYLPITQR